MEVLLYLIFINVSSREIKYGIETAKSTQAASHFFVLHVYGKNADVSKQQMSALIQNLKRSHGIESNLTLLSSECTCSGCEESHKNLCLEAQIYLCLKNLSKL